ncbi:MAG: hypothetical protein HC802_06765 [Caldilineaceae bacterium]|nr:hypothetical protein [Caldilineaceae bacterium]
MTIVNRRTFIARQGHLEDAVELLKVAPTTPRSSPLPASTRRALDRETASSWKWTSGPLRTLVERVGRAPGQRSSPGALAYAGRGGLD